MQMHEDCRVGYRSLTQCGRPSAVSALGATEESEFRVVIAVTEGNEARMRFN